MERADAVVVGGGAAGLAAAAEFTRAGRRVVVLEARDRLGGRIDTRADARAPVPVELGAEFIHGRPPEIDELVRAASLATYAPAGDHWRLRDGRLERVPDYWSRIGDLLKGLDPAAGDLPAAAFLEDRARRGREEDSALAREYVQGFHAADPRRIGTAYLAAAEGGQEEPGGAETRRVLGGYALLVDELAARAGGDLRPRTPVESIRWSTEGVEVRAGATAIASRVAVVTVPLGVLLLRPGQTGAIRFEPEPADHLDAARSLAMGQVTKAIVVLKEPFWERHDPRLRALSFLHLAGQPFPTWWSLHPISSGMLVGWAGGPAGDALAGRNADDLKGAAVTSLAAAFGESVSALRARIVTCWTKDWSQDPFARGGYAYVPVGAAWAPRRLAEPAGGTLFFAGEAVSGELSLGTVDAAIASGRRAARAALEAMT